MGKNIQGKYYSFTSASVVAGDDLMVKAETALGLSNIVAKKLTLISSGSLAIDINNLGVYSTLYRDADSLYKLSLDGYDCMIDSLKIGETSASPVFLAMVF
jgi:hypothetical protein